MRKFPTPADHGLWDDIKRTISPLKVKSQQTKAHQKKAPQTKAGLEKRTGLKSGHQQSHELNGSIPARQIMRHTVPALASFDRRLAQKLSRGQLEPDARLDLHGEGVETARMKLLHFLGRQHQLGVRLVLVITGKGASPFARHTLHGINHFHAPEREGRLRRELTEWLHEEIFRLHVIGYQPSHPRHGGGGAFYVRLRRPAGQDNHDSRDNGRFD